MFQTELNRFGVLAFFQFAIYLANVCFGFRASDFEFVYPVALDSEFETPIYEAS